MANESGSHEDASSIRDSDQMEGVFHSHLEKKVRPYIDLIDHLRLIGVGADIALPSIAVIGDQSSGKSSVLEALSGVALPRGSGIVTRCPLELKLRKIRNEVQWRAVITCKENSTEFTDPRLVEQCVQTAQRELAGDGVGICDELITLEIMSSDVCDLTLIDLPGIARVPVKDQPLDIGDQIKKLIRSFIEKSETINLVVVPCNVDIVTTEALKMAQEVDRDGKRTLAILTKPDLIDKGTEKNIMNVVRNQVIPLSRGYIIVKCRGQMQIDEDISLRMAIQEEIDFFRGHEFFSCLLHEEKATIQCLATKLTQHLVEHIRKSLPLLSEETKKQLQDLRNDLSQYETGPPLDSQNAKVFFINIVKRFSDKITCIAFGEASKVDNLFVWLRHVFRMWKDYLDSTKPSYHDKIQAVVREYDQKYRGRELPGFSDYSIFENEVQTLVMQLKRTAIETLRITRGSSESCGCGPTERCFCLVGQSGEMKVIQKEFIDVSQSCFVNYPYLQSSATNKINNIQSKQEAKVEQRIMELFEMEKLVYTQDAVYFKALNETCLARERVSEEDCAGLDSRNKYPEMLKAYYEIVVQRLADLVPMQIRYFLLKESAQMICCEMIGLVDGADLAEVLKEESDVNRQRNITQRRIERLTIAQQKLSKFV